MQRQNSEENTVTPPRITGMGNVSKQVHTELQEAGEAGLQIIHWVEQEKCKKEGKIWILHKTQGKKVKRKYNK